MYYGRISLRLRKDWLTLSRQWVERSQLPAVKIPQASVVPAETCLRHRQTIYRYYILPGRACRISLAGFKRCAEQSRHALQEGSRHPQLKDVLSQSLIIVVRGEFTAGIVWRWFKSNKRHDCVGDINLYLSSYF